MTARAPVDDLGPEEFRRLALVVEGEAGIVLGEAKIPLIRSRLSKRLRELGFDSYRAYCTLLESDEGPEEYSILIGALTTNVTAFFRERHHFDDLEAMLPALIERAKAGQRVRIWSAGCSIGAEPYSIALLVLKHWPSAAESDLKVLATDIDQKALAQAAAGRYRTDLLHKELPDEFLRRFSLCGEGVMELGPEARSLVTVRKLNLAKPWPVRGPFDAVFCRNVVIYFGPVVTEEIWSRFGALIRPGGRLYIGHSERLTGPAADQFEPVGITAYRATGGA